MKVISLSLSLLLSCYACIGQTITKSKVLGVWKPVAIITATLDIPVSDKEAIKIAMSQVAAKDLKDMNNATKDLALDVMVAALLSTTVEFKNNDSLYMHTTYEVMGEKEDDMQAMSYKIKEGKIITESGEEDKDKDHYEMPDDRTILIKPAPGSNDPGLRLRKQ